MLNGRQILIALAIKHGGDWDKIYQALTEKEVSELEECYKQFELSTCKATTILDSDYPQILKEIYMPPFVLFYYGDITLTHNPDKCLSVIGSRNPTSYGEKMTEEAAKLLFTVCRIEGCFGNGRGRRFLSEDFMAQGKIRVNDAR